jgi:hypothetical protein
MEAELKHNIEVLLQEKHHWLTRIHDDNKKMAKMLEVSGTPALHSCSALLLYSCSLNSRPITSPASSCTRICARRS